MALYREVALTIYESHVGSPYLCTCYVVRKILSMHLLKLQRRLTWYGAHGSTNRSRTDRTLRSARKFCGYTALTNEWHWRGFIHGD